jgi:ketosteroid isomerase-like protein
MSISRDYDPLATVVDWLDFCRSGEAGLLLSLYDDEAVLECECERVSLCGRQALQAYWRTRLQTKSPFAFDLDDLTSDPDGVTLKHRNHKGDPVQIQFRFTESGKILQTTCSCLRKIG